MTAQAAQARDDVGEPFLERLPFGGTLEAAVLVEELRVEVEDAVADEMEAEVAGLDHAGVDRPDRDLVGVVAAHRHVQRSSAGSWSTSGRSGSWPSKRIPWRSCASRSSQPAAGARSTIEGTTPSSAATRLEARRPVRCDEQRAHERPVRGRVQAGEAPAVGERRGDPSR